VVFVETLVQLIETLSEIPSCITFVDSSIQKLYPGLVEKLSAHSSVYFVDATEENKTLRGAERVIQQLSAEKANKSTTIVAIGGGVVQDIVSFVAHIYFRGLKFIFVPTTLLAMCDSCIGGKCGLNFHGYKNQLGAFHPPEKVFICHDFLMTLEDDALYCGYGEIIKLLLIGDIEAYVNVKSQLLKSGIRNKNVLQHIYQGLVIKKKFIEEDEYDVGVRQILNYGHTFGHALELATQYAMPHGIAVVWGICLANYIAFQKGLLSKQNYEDVNQFMKHFFPMDGLKTVSSDQLILFAQQDKKSKEGKIMMILMKDFENFILEPVVLDHEVQVMLDSYFESYTL